MATPRSTMATAAKRIFLLPEVPVGGSLFASIFCSIFGEEKASLLSWLSSNSSWMLEFAFAAATTGAWASPVFGRSEIGLTVRAILDNSGSGPFAFVVASCGMRPGPVALAADAAEDAAPELAGCEVGGVDSFPAVDGNALTEAARDLDCAAAAARSRTVPSTDLPESISGSAESCAESCAIGATGLAIRFPHGAGIAGAEARCAAVGGSVARSEIVGEGFVGRDGALAIDAATGMFSACAAGF